MGTGILSPVHCRARKRSFEEIVLPGSFCLPKSSFIFLMQVVASGRIFLGLVEGDPFGILPKTKSR